MTEPAPPAEVTGSPGPPVGLRDRWCGLVGVGDIGSVVRLCGWVARRREHGEHLAFVDLRDRTGVIQCVVDGAHDLRPEHVVRITGTVRARPPGTENPRLSTGTVEVGDCTVEVLSTAEPPPFPVVDDLDASEEVRMRYRFVDLRRPRMQRMLRVRAQVNAALRRAMAANGFTEVETPLLWTPTPEGAREFVVPARLQRGSFYVLPQSPQIAKQILMVAGVDRYYQIARCFRDEDLRADRQFEFTQLDLEASFVTDADVRSFVTDAVAEATEAVRGIRPEIPTLTWAEAMDRYGTDKPDLRFGMEIVDLTSTFTGTGVRAFASAETVRAIVVPGGAGRSRREFDALTDRARSLGAGGLAWMKVDNDGTLASPLARHLTEAEAAGIRERTGAGPGDLVLVVADTVATARRVLGQLRLDLGAPPPGEGGLRYVWVTEFPMFEGLDEAGRPVPAHHPFTMPHPGDWDLLEDDPLAVRSLAYDLVLNGWELGSGSIRIHRPDLQRRVFAALGITDAEAEERFGFLLGAFRYGAPPHGGFAFGVDRLVALLAGEENIREAIAFPKTQSGHDPLTGAPKPVDPALLAELGLAVIDPG